MHQLFCAERGSGGVPVVLLHGFGASHADWDEVVAILGGERLTLAYDLPGHAESLVHEASSAAAVARAVLADLAGRGIGQAHWVGHSMGGAAAAIAALMEPLRTASLTLLAPGGFGSEINHRLLRRYASAAAEDEIESLLEQFFGWDRSVPQGLSATRARERQAAGATEALQRIVERFFTGQDGSATGQKTIGAADLARLALPIKVLWGTQDRVLPTRQAHKLPGRIAVHIFERTGHMLPQEIPREVAYLVLENTR